LLKRVSIVSHFGVKDVGKQEQLESSADLLIVQF